MNLNNLVVELKKEGIEVAEEGAKGIARAVISWLELECVASNNVFVKMVSLVLEKAKPLIMELLEKINPND